MEQSAMQPQLNPEAVNQQFAEMTAPLEAERQATEIQAQENMIAMMGIAMRFRNSNPELADKITAAAVLNRYAPQIEEAMAAQQADVRQQQATVARDYHESDSDKKESIFA
jgi:hypothetical protein